jgi:Common central domain of tyrosinase
VNNNFLGQFNSAWGLNRSLGAGGRPLPTQQQVEDNQRRDNYGTFWPELEHPIHNWPHSWVGGVMASAASPGDPVFYLHHCWIDLLWARWQHSHPDAPFVSSQAGAGLNDPLTEWPDRTPADVLDHHALGYRYDVEPPEGGRIMIADFCGGQVPAQVRYWENWGGDWENWGEHPLFNGWQDDNDLQFVGDFMHLGYDQLLSVNRTDAGDGRIMIADFSGGQVPAQVRYWENWGQDPLFNGWQHANDWQLVGDFMRLGHHQLLSVNRG